MTLTDPNLGYLLLLIGLWCSVFSIYKPGTGLFEPLSALGLIGAILIMASLPTNWIGAGLVIVGVLAFLLVPLYRKFPALFALVGLALQTAGGLVLYDGLAVSPLILAATVIGSFGLFLFVLRPLLVKQSQAPVVSGDESIIGKSGYVTKTLDPVGTVNIGGESWTAYSTTPLQPGERVTVIDKEGLRLVVEKTKAKRLPLEHEANEEKLPGEDSPMQAVKREE